MKHEKISIKWRIFLYLLLFTGLLIALLWFFQIVYLDEFYKMIKQNTAKTVEQSAASILKSDSDEKENDLDALAAENNVTIYVTDNEGNEIYNCEYISTTKMNTLPAEEFERFYQQAEANGGMTQIEFKGNRKKIMDSSEELEAPPEEADAPEKPWLEQDEFIQNHGQNMAESIIYVEIITTEDVEYVLMVNSVLTPVDATVETLRIQMIWITIVMVLLSMIVALLIAKKVSKSMIRVNESAKELAKGNFEVTFDGKDYREIAELSNTLNQAAIDLGKNEQFQRELIANVSHDLRTPLTMITAYSEVMRDLPGENTPENVQVVIDEAKRLTNLVNDMLDISKLQAGALQMNVTEFDLTESVQNVLSRYNKLREQEGYLIDFEYKEAVTVNADEFKISQVLYNLINNAVNYAGDSKKVFVRQIHKGQKVRIEVTDYGEGIAKENLPYIWERYYKVDKTHKRAVMGTGLGLPIVKSILELHHSNYGVESTEGVGTTFWFELDCI